ncbi:Hypothetical predicted protein, partial [Paramuricea clavata]
MEMLEEMQAEAEVREALYGQTDEISDMFEDHLSELIESMKYDALEQAKKDTEKRRRKAKREYRKTQRFIEKEDLRRQIKINKDFDKLLKQEKRTTTERLKKEIKSTADQFRKRRKQIKINARKATREAKTWGREIGKEEKKRRKGVLHWKVEARKWKKESQRLRRNEKARERRAEQNCRIEEDRWKGKKFGQLQLKLEDKLSPVPVEGGGFETDRVREEIRLECIKKKTDPITGEVTTDSYYPSSFTSNIFPTTNISEKYDEASEKISNDISEFQKNGSGWTLKKVVKMKYQIVRGAGFSELPRFITNKKTIINIKNEDNMCFKYAVTRALHPVESVNLHVLFETSFIENMLQYGGY